MPFRMATAQTATNAAPVSPPAAPAQRSAAELERLVAPIALHPDPLIAVILPASVYPVEIVQAARFVRDTNNIPKIDEQSWDENVKAVAKFPELIAKLDAELAWTVELGQAFLDQPKDVMDMIQSLRAKAQKAGTLRTSEQQIVVVTNTTVETVVEQQVVVVTNTIVQIEPANPQYIYVPSYPVTVYYPPPAYVYNPYAPLVTFGAGVAVGLIIANNCDWHGGYVYHGHSDVDIDINRNTTINRGERPTPNRDGTRPAQQKWQPDQTRLRNNGAGAGGASASTREARGWSSNARPTTQPSIGTRPVNPGVGAATRSSTGTVGARPTTYSPATSPGVNRPSQPANVSRQPNPSMNRPAPTGGSAFGGVNNGSAARSSSNRGMSSHGGGGGGRGGGRR